MDSDSLRGRDEPAPAITEIQLDPISGQTDRLPETLVALDSREARDGPAPDVLATQLDLNAGQTDRLPETLVSMDSCEARDEPGPEELATQRDLNAGQTDRLPETLVALDSSEARAEPAPEELATQRDLNAGQTDRLPETLVALDSREARAEPGPEELATQRDLNAGQTDRLPRTLVSMDSSEARAEPAPKELATQRDLNAGQTDRLPKTLVALDSSEARAEPAPEELATQRDLNAGQTDRLPRTLISMDSSEARAEPGPEELATQRDLNAGLTDRLPETLVPVDSCEGRAEPAPDVLGTQLDWNVGQTDGLPETLLSSDGKRSFDRTDRAPRERIVDATLTSAPEPFPPKGAPGTKARSLSGSQAPRSEPEGYEILGRLGRGGMGVVYKARHRKLNRLVALKMILGAGQDDPEQLARFRAEAEAIARFRHPNIVQIYDIGEHMGCPFVSLELLEGGSLADRLAGTPQPGPAATALMATLASGMEVAHQAGIIHRDLKPSNILFTGDGVPRIADFGLAKRLEAEEGQTISGQIMGTPSYMAPEQAQGRTHECTAATDVYALGAILYEMLTGRPPFKGPTAMETVRQVSEDDPVSPAKLQPKLPRDLVTICLKCLAKESAKRYARAQELADDLRRYLAGEPILARRTGVAERAAKWARRHPTLATLMGLALITIATGSVTWMRYQDGVRRRQEQATAVARRQAREEITRVSTLRESADKDLFESQGMVAKGLWNEARPLLTGLLTRLQGEPALSTQKGRAAFLLAQAEKGNTNQLAGEADRRRLDKFLARRDDALLHETRFTGLDLPTNLEETRRAARAALAVFAAPASTRGWSLGPLPANLTETEKTTVRDGCYELLLILAEAEDKPEEGLKDLDCAARLNPAPTRAYHLRRAACLERRRENDAAARERSVAEALRPATAFDHFLAGQEWYRRGEWQEALRDFDSALRLQPENFWSHALAAICSLQLKRPAEAKAELNACLQRERGLAWLYLLRGFASAQIADLAGSAAEKLAPRDASLRRDIDDQLSAAAADYDEAVKLLRERPADELNYVARVNRGLLKLQQQDFEGALTELQEAVRQNGRGFPAHAGLGQVYQRQNRPDLALEQFGQAIALKPDYAPLYRGRAEVTLGRKDATAEQRESALLDLDQAVRLEHAGNKVVALDHTNRGRLLRLLGRDELALAACDAALAVVPDHREAHVLRIGTLVELGRFDDVTRSCDVALASGKPTAEIYQLRGVARELRRDYSGAIADFTLALSLRPGWTDVLLRRGWAYVVAKAPELALADFDEVIRLDPRGADSYSGRATTRAHLGRYQEAVADAEESLARGAKSSTVAYKAARVYAQAARAAAGDVERKGRAAVTLASRYQDRAVELVGDAVQKQPAGRRVAFWRDILADPDLRPLRKRLSALAMSDSVAERPKPSN